MLPRSATNRHQLAVDGEYYSVRRAQQVAKEVSYANLNEMPVLDNLNEMPVLERLEGAEGRAAETDLSPLIMYRRIAKQPPTK